MSLRILSSIQRYSTILLGLLFITILVCYFGYRNKLKKQEIDTIESVYHSCRFKAYKIHERFTVWMLLYNPLRPDKDYLTYRWGQLILDVNEKIIKLKSNIQEIDDYKSLDSEIITTVSDINKVMILNQDFLLNDYNERLNFYDYYNKGLFQVKVLLFSMLIHECMDSLYSIEKEMYRYFWINIEKDKIDSFFKFNW